MSQSGATAIITAINKPDPALIAKFINQEHNRLCRHVRTLEKLLHGPYTPERFDRVILMTDIWCAVLTFEDGVPKLVDTLDMFAHVYAGQSDGVEGMYYTVVWQVGVYRKEHWEWANEFVPGITAYIDQSGFALPEEPTIIRR